MPYCHECGKEIQRGVKFCPECGAPQARAGAADSVPTVSARPSPPRSGLVRAVSLLQILFGVVLLGFGVLALFFAAVSPGIYALSLVIFLGGGAIAVFSGYGLLRRQSWARLGGTLGGIALIVIGIVLVLSTNPFFLALGMIGILLGIFSSVIFRLRSYETYLHS